MSKKLPEAIDATAIVARPLDEQARILGGLSGIIEEITDGLLDLLTKGVPNLESRLDKGETLEQFRAMIRQGVKDGLKKSGIDIGEDPD